MRVTGIICEYNPFHNGHALHLNAAREKTQADFVLCVMSGPFVQRGEPAMLDKWARTEAALCNGADMVLELPVLWAMRAAQDFAFGGVSLLNHLNVVTHLSFGSETEDLDALRSFAAPEDEETSEKIKEYLKEGFSHPAARAKAQGISLPPNAMLAVEYLRALDALHSTIKPVPVLRTVSHTDETLHKLASASAIRRAILRGEDPSCAVPDGKALTDALPKNPPTLEALSPILLYLLRTTAPETLREKFAIPEGLENRICRAAGEAVSVGELLTQVQSRRYPAARLRRLLVQIVLGMEAPLLRRHPVPEYARILGFRRSARPLLHALSESSALPLILQPADAEKTELLQLDMKSQDVWDLLSGNPAYRDLTTRLPVL